MSDTIRRVRICLARFTGALLAVWTPAVAGAADAGQGFTIEGLADPAYVKQRFNPTDAAQLEERVCQEAYGDALQHLSAYTRGVPFAFDFTVPPAEWKRRPFGDVRFQPLGMVLPKNKQYRVLGTNLMLAEITFAESDVERLGLPKGLKELPAYVAEGQFPNDLYPGYQPMLWTTVHWLAATDCYRSAIMKHLARSYGNRPVTKVSGRVFPVRVVKASFEKMAAPPASPTTSTAPAPSAPFKTPAPPATPPSDAPGGNTEEKKADAPKADAPKADAGPAETLPEAAPEAVAAEALAPRQVDLYFYRLEMEVHVEIENVEFGDQVAPKPAESQTKPAPAPEPVNAAPPAAAPATEPAPEPAPANEGTPSGS